MNDKTEGEKICEELLKTDINNHFYWIAYVHTFGDDPEKVYSMLEKSFSAKEKNLTYLGVNPAFKKFRNEPRVERILKQMKFPI